MSLRAAATLALAWSVAAPAAVPAADRPAPAPLCGDGALDILLTNDDGFDSAGIRALLAALREGGHRVLLVAPATNASGSSSSFTWGAVRVVRDPGDQGVVSVAATPATAVVLGATALYPAGRGPDLVISGINDGTNTGSLLALSGTVGAALAGTMLLDPPVPGIAVNAARPPTPEARQGLPPDHLAQVARHVAGLVAASRDWFCERDRVVRATTVLNVNYPARPLAEVAGVRVATQGRTTDLRVVFEPGAEGQYASRRVAATPTHDDRDSDVALLDRGYVTVTPVDARLDARGAATRSLQRRLSR